MFRNDRHSSKEKRQKRRTCTLKALTHLARFAEAL